MKTSYTQLLEVLVYITQKQYVHLQHGLQTLEFHSALHN